MVPPALALMGAKTGLKASKQYSVSILGYDFIGLAMRLFLFLAIGVLINGYMNATMGLGGFVNSIAGFFNIKFPSTVPEWLTKLFTTGYNGVTFFQALQISAILLVVFEYLQYDRSLKEKGEKPNVTTQGLFLLIALALSILVIPQTVQKFKEMKIING